MRYLMLLATLLCLFAKQECSAYTTPFIKIDGIYYELNKMEHRAAVVGEASYFIGSNRDSLGWGYYSGDIVIPGSIEYEGMYYRVTELYLEAFGDCEVASLTIPETVKFCHVPWYKSRDFQTKKIRKIYLSSWDWFFKELGHENLDMLNMEPYPARDSYPGRDPYQDPDTFHPFLFGVCDTLYVNGEKVDLENFVVPDGIEYLPEECFMYSTKLRSITIPKSVKGINQHGILFRCDNLEYIVSYLESPTELAWNDFSIRGKHQKPTVLYVPKGTAELYRRLKGWNTVARIIEFDVNEGVVIPD